MYISLGCRFLQWLAPLITASVELGFCPQVRVQTDHQLVPEIGDACLDARYHLAVPCHHVRSRHREGPSRTSSTISASCRRAASPPMTKSRTSWKVAFTQRTCALSMQAAPAADLVHVYARYMRCHVIACYPIHSRKYGGSECTTPRWT